MYGPDLTGLFRVLLIGVIAIVAWGVFGAYSLFKQRHTYESKFKVNPDFRLEANRKKIDTIWIYQFNK